MNCMVREVVGSSCLIVKDAQPYWQNCHRHVNSQGQAGHRGIVIFKAVPVKDLVFKKEHTPAVATEGNATADLATLKCAWGVFPFTVFLVT